MSSKAITDEISLFVREVPIKTEDIDEQVFPNHEAKTHEMKIHEVKKQVTPKRSHYLVEMADAEVFMQVNLEEKIFVMSNKPVQKSASIKKKDLTMSGTFGNSL